MTNQSLVLMWCLVAGASCFAAEPGGPDAAIDSFRLVVQSVETFTATVERVQSYRQANRSGKGSVTYVRSRGSAYRYRQPGAYLFICNDSAGYGADLRKKSGWQCSGIALEKFRNMRRQIDPLYRLLALAEIDVREFIFLGLSGNRLYFSVQPAGALRCNVGFDTESFRCRIVEVFGSTGEVVEKITFDYGTGVPSLFPVSMVITESAGGSLSIDSISFKRQHNNGRIDSADFEVPRGINWRDCGGGLSGRDFNPVAGP
jgi:hypothetical protein